MSACVCSVCGFTLLLWMSMAQQVCGYASVLQREAEFDVTYRDTVTSDNQTIYAFNCTVSSNTTVAFRVAVEVFSETPIQFVLRQKHSVLSFEIPLIIRDSNERTFKYSSMERTLCPPHTPQLSGEDSLFVDVWTGSDSSQYQLRVVQVDNFNLETNKKLSFTASPSQPQFFKYVYPEGVDRVTVKVTSETKFPCSFLSIQYIQCPVYDLESNVDFLGMYQTITTLGAIIVQRKDFVNGFYVVVAVNPEDEACGGLSDSSMTDTFRDAGERTKRLEVVVSPSTTFKVTSKDAFAIVMGVFLLIVIIYLVVLVVTWPTSGMFFFVPFFVFIYHIPKHMGKKSIWKW
ncbi:SID1 transmembrane family member 2-like [Boleophthalmus pectinirostris]|uniref:SID1 transmembrane family member 2-like n=1 Tax=Boleophthalmus pectinirostris TaxID=150288 RepID=UPI0024305FDB|nr:SID1 transmembrane family member 2-like [Boleophthalmus pectinirostris]